MKKKIVSFLLALFGIAILYTAVHFLIFEPNTFKGTGDFLNTFLRTTQGIFGFIVSIYGIAPLFKKEPPALVITPDTAMSNLKLPLVGRDSDFKWLQDTNGDKVLVGQPGSGKTFLLYKFAKRGNGLFVNISNLRQIKREYERKKPKTIIIDDAQLHLELIRGLIHFRKKDSAEFEILASCWPSHEDDVLSALNVPTKSSHYLNLLTLDQLVEVVKAVGLLGPSGLIQEIVEQSVGRPGLAVVLTELCLKEGGVQYLVQGNALARWVTTQLLPLTNSTHADAILASFSVGGDAGMPMKTVADQLGLTLLEIQQVISNLTGGLIFDKAPNLAVYPPALRHSLVGEKFFRGAMSLPIAEFISNAPSLHDVVKTLIGARRRGAMISQELLLENLELLNLGTLWEDFAYLGKSEATWVLENKPEVLMAVAHPTLLHTPTKGIPLLLSAAIGDERELHPHPDHPLRLIQDWVTSAIPGKGQAIKRRRILLDSVIKWMETSKEVKPGIRSLLIALTPEFSDTITSPGSGNSITFRSAYLGLEEIHELEQLWADVLPIIKNVNIQHWHIVQQIIETWAYPGRLGNVSDEIYENMKTFAKRMLIDLLPLIKEHPGFLHWANHVAKNARLSISVPVDKTFEILYPDVDLVEFHQDPTEQTKRISDLALLWSSDTPSEVMKEIGRMEEEAKFSKKNWPRLTPNLSVEISKIVEDQISWIDAGLQEGIEGDILFPFIKKVIESRKKGWIGKIKQLLQIQSIRPYIIQLILFSPKMPKSLLDAAYLNLDKLDEIIEVWCMRKEIPEERVLCLLQHNNPKVAIAAAKGEWNAEQSKEVRSSLTEQWEQVIVSSLTDEYLLSEILKKRPELASRWLSMHIHEIKNADETFIDFNLKKSFKIAASWLEHQDKLALMKSIEPFMYDYLVVLPMIGNDLDLYQALLENKQLKHLHLDPLHGKPNDVWVSKAIIAMEASYSPEAIAHATKWASIRNMDSGWYSGNESDMWANWIQSFEPYLEHEKEKIREVARIATESAKLARDRALREELQEAVFGRR